MLGFYRHVKHLLCAIFVFCTVALSSQFAFAEYMCSTAKYTSCASGYFMTYNGVYNATPQAGNACTACPTGWTCSGGTAAPTRTCSAGTYLAKGATSCTTCPSGSYCPGGTVNYNASSNQRIFACSVLASGFYPNSAAGSDAANDCYTNSLSGKYVASAYATSATSCAAGTYKGSHTVKYGSTSSCSSCTDATYSAAGASSCTSCPNGGAYYDANGNGLHDTVKECYKNVTWSVANGTGTQNCYYTSGSGTSAVYSGNDIAGCDTKVITSCNSGYTKSSDGTKCTGNTITLSWANGGRGTVPTGAPTSCTYGNSFTVASGMSATGYTFGGWKSSQKTLTAGASAACNYANLGVYSGTATLTGQWTIKSVKCNPGTYLPKGKTACETCPQSTTSNGSTVGTYCPGGTFNYNASSNQGLNACPVLSDSTAMQSSSYPNNDDGGAATLTSRNNSAWYTGQDDISDCLATYYFQNSAGRFTMEGVHYSSTSGRYDSGGGKYYTTLNPGYYLTTKFSDTYCDTSASNYAQRKKLYRTAKKCTAGSYCPGYSSAMPLCSSTNETYDTNMGIFTCDGATYSAAGAASCTPCPDGYTYDTSAGKKTAASCRIQCPAGTTIASRYGKCTSPAGGWWAPSARIASYGNMTPVNYCMAGYTNSGTTATNHDAQSDCTKTVAGESVSTTIPVRYIRLKSAGNTVNAATHVVEIQAFASSNGTGTNLLSGKGSTDNLKNATDGTFTQSVYAGIGANYYLTWDMGSVQNIGSIKFALYSADNRLYNNVQIEVSSDNSTWTTVFGPQNVATPKANGTDAAPELLVLAEVVECAAGTYATSTSVALGATKSCSACTGATYSGANASSCTACPNGGSYFDANGNGAHDTVKECYKNVSWSVANGTGTQNCYYTSGSGTSAVYSGNDIAGCDTKVITSCNTGYSKSSDGTACTQNKYSCDPGYYWNGTQCTQCDNSQYYCPGATDAVYGAEKGLEECPAETNPYGAASATLLIDTMKLANFDGVRDTISDCAVNYVFAEEWYANALGVGAEYDADSDLNKRGFLSVGCHYDSTTKQYDNNCVGGAYFCAGGYYSPKYANATSTSDFRNITYSADSVSELVSQICIPVGANYWSPSAEGMLSGSADSSAIMLASVKRTACPANSSTKGSTTAEYCTCNTGYDSNGGTTTTTNACTLSTYEITLNAGVGTGLNPTKIYAKPGFGWYSDAAAGDEITSVTMPYSNQSGADWLFMGFFTEQNGSGTQVISKNGNIVAPDFMFEGPATVYAYYEKCQCTAGDGVESCVSIVDSEGTTCTYQVTCESGYNKRGSFGTTTFTESGDARVLNTEFSCVSSDAKTGYVCPPDSSYYTSCYEGKYMAVKDASGNYAYNGTPQSGNSCENCPGNAAYCPGGTSAPLYSVMLGDDIEESVVVYLYANENGEYYTNEDGSLTNVTLESLTRLNTLPIEYRPQYSGQTFNGYWTQSTGGEQYIDANGNFLKGPSSSISLYAQWEQCAAGSYEENGACVICPKGSYCADGVKNTCSNGTYQDTTGQSSCKKCPTANMDGISYKVMPMNYGNNDVDNSGSSTDSVAECVATYMYADEVAANAMGLNAYFQNYYHTHAGYLFCFYNETTGQYTGDCSGYPMTCPAGYRHGNGVITDANDMDQISLRNLSLDEYMQSDCVPVDEGYFSPAYLSDNSVSPLETLNQVKCGENSSTNGANCKCNAGYNYDGSTTTTTEACTPNIYTVDFDANGGAGEMPGQPFTYDVAQNLTANAFTRDWYTFAGWNTAADGSGTAYADGESVNNLTDENGVTITLYAQWKPECYKITLDNTEEALEFWGNYIVYGDEYYWDTCDGTLVTDDELHRYAFPLHEIPNGTSIGYYNETEIQCIDEQGHWTYFCEPRANATWHERFTCDNADYVVITQNGKAECVPSTMTILYGYDAGAEVEATVTCTGKEPCYLGCSQDGSDWDCGTPVMVKDGYTLAGFNVVDDIDPDAGTEYYQYGTDITGWATKYDAVAGGPITFMLYAEPVWEENCHKVSLWFAPDEIEDYYIKETNATQLFSDSMCSSPISSFNKGVHLNGSFVGYYSPNGILCIDSNLNITGNCVVTNEEEWWAGYNCNVGYHPSDNDDDIVEPDIQCNPNIYTVDFDANGGAGEMPGQPFTYDIAQNLTPNIFTRTGYIFGGWNTASDGSGTAYADGESVNNLTTENGTTITLYAQWSQCGAGTYSENGECVICPKGYACADGVKRKCGDGTYADKEGMSECTACPVATNQYGAAYFGVTSSKVTEEYDILDSIDTCAAMYYYMPEYMVEFFIGMTVQEAIDGFGYDPNTDANKRGIQLVACSYNSATDTYTTNCEGYAPMCEGGYYSTKVPANVDPENFDVGELILQTDTLDEFLAQACVPVGTGYWSPDGEGLDFENADEQELIALLQRNQCPDNGTTATTTSDSADDCYKANMSCTVEHGSGETTCHYTTDGYTNCAEPCVATNCNDGYYLNDGACVICPLGSYCANGVKTACDPDYTTSSTGATNAAQCTKSCEIACIQQTCPDNATCIHGTETVAGTQIQGGTCDAVATTCTITVTCDAGYYMNNGACDRAEFTVAFNANGGTGTMAEQTFTYGVPQNLTTNAFIKSGFVFAGWNTVSDGSGTDYDDKALISNLLEDITLYAQWSVAKLGCDAGFYLDGAECKECTPGHYCEGGEWMFQEGKVQGLLACPELYPDSAALSSKQSDCTITCAGGQYVATKYAACENVGEGYWIGVNTVGYGEISTRNACNDNMTTIGYGPGADEADDCGHKLHVNDEVLYLRKAEKTDVSLHIKIDGVEFYGNMRECDIKISDGATQTLRIKYGDKVYSVYDDSQGDINEDCELISYNIEYALNGGDESESLVTKYNVKDTTVLNAPTRENSVFVGWYDNPEFTGNAISKIVPGTVGTKKLYAKWGCASGFIANAANTACVGNGITISFDANGGSDVANSTCIYGESLTLSNVPVKFGYDFTGWQFTNGQFVDATDTNVPCEYGTIGAYNGTVSATAQWAAKSIECAAGTYLPANSETCASCPAGYACAGGTYKYSTNSEHGNAMCSGSTYSESGASTCSTCPDGYTISIEGDSTAHDEISDCKITCAAGQELMAGASTCNTCQAESKKLRGYCPGGEYGYNADELQGWIACPTSEDTWITKDSDLWLDGYEITEVNIAYANKVRSSIGDCQLTYTFEAAPGRIIREGLRYNPNTNKYDTFSWGGGNEGNRSVRILNPGYYAYNRNRRMDCNALSEDDKSKYYMTYSYAAECPEGYYCPGYYNKREILPRCDDTEYVELYNDSIVNGEYAFGAIQCPEDRPNSPAGSDSEADCY